MVRLSEGWRETIFTEVSGGKGPMAMLRLPAKHEMFLTGVVARGTTIVTHPSGCTPQSSLAVGRDAAEPGRRASSMSATSPLSPEITGQGMAKLHSGLGTAGKKLALQGEQSDVILVMKLTPFGFPGI